jgi:hypothetical protein
MTTKIPAELRPGDYIYPDVPSRKVSDLAVRVTDVQPARRAHHFLIGIAWPTVGSEQRRLPDHMVVDEHRPLRVAHEATIEPTWNPMRTTFDE